MGDFDSKFAQGLNTMEHPNGLTVPPAAKSPAPSGTPWNVMLVNKLLGEPEHVQAPAQEVTDPYSNFSNKVTGRPYR